MAKAKIIKKKRRIRIEALASLLLTLSMVAFFAAQYGLKSYNYNLSVKKNEIEQQAKELEEKVADLQTEVTELQNRERVLSVAEKENIKTNQDNVTVVDGSSKE